MFLGKSVWKNVLGLKNKNVQVIFRKNKYFDINVFSCLSSTNGSQNCFSLFSYFMRKWGWFQGHDVRFPQNLVSRSKFQKTETLFFRWKSNDYNDIDICLSLKNPCTFCFQKKKPENTFLKLTVNYRKIIQKKTYLYAKQNSGKLTN